MVKAATKNRISGKEIITLLLNQRSNEFKIIEEVVKAAAKNKDGGKVI